MTSQQILQKKGVYLFQVPQGTTNWHALVNTAMTFLVTYNKWFFFAVPGSSLAPLGKGRGVHRVVVGKPEGKRPLGRPRRRWEDNIKMDLQEGGWRLDGVGSG